MRSLRIRDGIREARQTLSEGWRLFLGAPGATLLLGAVLALLPAAIKGFWVSRTNAAILSQWDAWLAALSGGGQPAFTLSQMIQASLYSTGQLGLGVTLFDWGRSLVLYPLLLASLALLYNGFVPAGGKRALYAVQTAAKQVKSLILVALACTLAQWIVQMLPSIVSGILSLLADMLGWIPVVGSIVTVLAIILSLLVSLATDFAVVVIFCYVWICAVCEGVPNLGALVRSWQLTRNALHRTIFSLLALTLLRWVAFLLLTALWLFVGRPLGMPVSTVLYILFLTGAAHTVCLGAVTSALYRHRPYHEGPRPGQFRSGGPDLDGMKRANL